jgi:hypothetical protein
LRLPLLSHGHYSRFCCSLTASAALSKCQIDPTKDLIPPLAASPTLSRPLFPLLLLSCCCSLTVLLFLNAKLTLQKNLFLLLHFSYSLSTTIPASAALLQPLLLLLNANLTLQKNQFLSCGFSYSLTATIPAAGIVADNLLLSYSLCCSS